VLAWLLIVSRLFCCAAVCANINLFMEMNEEEMEKYLQTFVTDIWHLLMQVCARSDGVLHLTVSAYLP
jgi:hypothetical protein